ncbi:MAG: TrkH family potassium uptake protein [Candidatus Aenigmarchaeota archaeon]|nr:TrkH family potassium uptake protein [Candidatus Aenigmarchaeota archaeon]
MVSYFISKHIKIEKTTEFRHALVVVALIWLIAALLSAIPFVFVLKMNFLDSFFEAMSAWTTTGLTVINNVEAVPFTLLFWRSFMQWVGGIGIVVAVLGGVFKLGSSMFFAEAREEKIKPNVINTIRTILWIYLFYTSFGFVLLVIFGMPVFDSINHVMTAISTGGMSVKNSSISYYNNIYIEMVLMFIMLCGSISFLSHFNLLKGNIRYFIRDLQLRSLVILLLIAFFVLMLFISPAREAAFQVISASSGTGFSTADLSAWNDFSKSVLILLMVVGGCAGSTAGGLKLIRVITLFKSAYWNLRMLMTPGVVINKKIGDKILKNQDIRVTLIFILLYIMFLLLGSFVFMGLGFSGTNSFFEVASAQGNVGLSTGITSASLHYLGKIMLIINMWVGRLEIWAIFIMISSIFIRR